MSGAGSPTLSIEGKVATLTLRRPDEHNRIDADDPQAVSQHLQEIVKHPDVAVLVLTGTGEKTFCAGYTLTQISSRLDQRFEDMLDQIEHLPIPTICAMNGSAYGGGTDLAMSCDFRIGVHGSRLFMPAAKFGLHYYPGGLRRFVERIGPAATKKIFLTAQSIDAEELLRIGYLTELVEREALDGKVRAYVESILLCERDAVKSMKQHIDALALGTWSEAAGRAAYEASLQSTATAERLTALNRAREA
ncbi:enoyl-CoA hydratase/isomerase family protein [Variovorax sp. PBL-E5]|uniref:enoyl-CoA hydratase/isomerase family protein n=1 Tax=Variovorax sp. PBL-E5 TaxID=434014 RepID=UPI0013164ACC|nr:enoyl-CoA hydratase/isomerase family protein [Variovorax sp. PBL-E5]VTU45841.1 Carnitinyl-CoA dehydratase [Variovorax sp. PBL-E5]